MELHNPVVWNTTDILASSIYGPFSLRYIFAGLRAMLDTSGRVSDPPSLYDHTDAKFASPRRVMVMDRLRLGLLMSGWKRLFEEESEHQWLSFAVFTIM